MLSESCHVWLSSVWALLRRQAELDGMPAINAKRVYRIMRQNALLLERKPLYRHRSGHILAKWP
ncbi:HTH-like domain protein (fragment) (plasmid) [Escherichia coli]